MKSNITNSLFLRILKAIIIHGISGSFKIVRAKSKRIFSNLKSSYPHNRVIPRDKDLDFDIKWGVNTIGIYHPCKSEIVGKNWIYGSKYEGCNAIKLYNVLYKLSISFADFSFIDFGSGKGRAILVASQFQFKQIFGIEYSKILYEISKRNIEQFPVACMKCLKIEVVCMDASKFSIPQGPLVIFLFNPFGRAVMKKIIRNISDSFIESPRQIIVIYFRPEFGDLWTNSVLVKEITSFSWASIYELKEAYN